MCWVTALFLFLFQWLFKKSTLRKDVRYKVNHVLSRDNIKRQGERKENDRRSQASDRARFDPRLSYKLTE